MAKAVSLFTMAVDGDIAQNAPIMLHQRLSEMLHYSQHIHDPDRIVELHAMRIAAKRLRYTMELFQPYIDPVDLRTAYESQLTETKKIQELIGEIHDRDVRVPLVYSFLTKHEHKKSDIRTGLNRFINEECRERDRLFDELITYWDGIRATYVSAMMHLITDIALYTPPAVIDAEREDPMPAPKPVSKRPRKVANA